MADPEGHRGVYPPTIEYSGQCGPFLIHDNVSQYELQYNSQIKLTISRLSCIKMFLQNDYCTSVVNRVTGAAEAQTPTLVTAKSLAMTAIDIMMSKELAEQMKKDFEEDMKKFDVE